MSLMDGWRCHPAVSSQACKYCFYIILLKMSRSKSSVEKNVAISEFFFFWFFGLYFSFLTTQTFKFICSSSLVRYYIESNSIQILYDHHNNTFPDVHSIIRITIICPNMDMP